MAVIRRSLLALVLGMTVVAMFVACAEETRVEQLSGIWSGESALEARRYHDLDSMTQGAGVVVVGDVVDVTIFRRYGPVGGQVTSAAITLGISQVISNQLVKEIRPGDRLVIEFPAGDEDRVETIRNAMEGATGLWFLANQEREWLRQGASADVAAEYVDLYILVSTQGFVLDDDGRAVAVWVDPDELPELAREITDRRFEELTAEVVELAKK